MLLLLRLCCRAYDMSLCLYPAALRETFGADMSDVFRRQMFDAWAEGGWCALVQALYYALRDLFTEALPARAGSPAAIAGAGSFVCTSTIFWCLLWAFQNPLAVRAIEHRILGG